jgi:hypothetical protein
MSPIRISVSLVLIPSIFGWILSGNRSGARVNSTTVNFVLSDQPYLPSDDELRRFWDLETIGINAGPYLTMSAKESSMLLFAYRINEERFPFRKSRISSGPTTESTQRDG